MYWLNIEIIIHMKWRQNHFTWCSNASAAMSHMSVRPYVKCMDCDRPKESSAQIFYHMKECLS